MRRVVIVLLALSLAACSGGGDEIGAVGGAVVRLSDIEALFDTDVIPAEGFRQTLFSYMAVAALTQALAADYGVTVDPAAVEEYVAQFEAAMAEGGATPAAFFGIPGASAEMVRFQAGGWALRDAAVAALVGDPAVIDGFLSDPATLGTVCVKHILVGSAEAAEATRARLEAGEDFAAVAGEVSLDTGTLGGDLGCGRAGRYVPAFAQAALEAPLGELTGPVETSFGFHLLIVSERNVPTREDFLADPEAWLSDDDLAGIWTDWFGRVLQAADAWVAERYGVWTPVGIQAPTASSGTAPG